MDFNKKLKTRLNIAIAYIVIGAVFTALGLTDMVSNEFFSVYGLALIVMGFARIRRYKLITRNDETIGRQRIAENDERNIAIMQKAKSVAFGITVLLAGLCVIVFEIIGRAELAYIMAAVVMVMTLIYWISYIIVRRKN